MIKSETDQRIKSKGRFLGAKDVKKLKRSQMKRRLLGLFLVRNLTRLGPLLIERSLRMIKYWSEILFRKRNLRSQWSNPSKIFKKL